MNASISSSNNVIYLHYSEIDDVDVNKVFLVYFDAKIVGTFCMTWVFQHCCFAHSEVTDGRTFPTTAGRRRFGEQMFIFRSPSHLNSFKIRHYDSSASVFLAVEERQTEREKKQTLATWSHTRENPDKKKKKTKTNESPKKWICSFEWF